MKESPGLYGWKPGEILLFELTYSRNKQLALIRIKDMFKEN